MAKHDVFISYHKSDRRIVEHLATLLLSRSFTVWWDFVAGAGEKWRGQVAEALNESKVVVCLWSPAALASSTCMREAREARNANKILPVALKDFTWSQVPDSLWDICIRIALYDENDQRGIDWLISELRFRKGFVFGECEYEIESPPSSEPPLNVPQISKSMLEGFRGKREPERRPIKDIATVQEWLRSARPDIVERGRLHRANAARRLERIRAQLENEYLESLEPVIDLQEVRRARFGPVRAAPVMRFAQSNAVALKRTIPAVYEHEIPADARTLVDTMLNKLPVFASGGLSSWKLQVVHEVEEIVDDYRDFAPLQAFADMESRSYEQGVSAPIAHMPTTRIRFWDSIVRRNLFGSKEGGFGETADLSWLHVTAAESGICWFSLQDAGDAAWPEDIRRLLEAEPGVLPNAGLSTRQLECLRLSGLGRTKREIGEQLGINKRTVRGHLKRACHVLGVVSTKQAIEAAVARALIVL